MKPKLNPIPQQVATPGEQDDLVQKWREERAAKDAQKTQQERQNRDAWRPPNQRSGYAFGKEPRDFPPRDPGFGGPRYGAPRDTRSSYGGDRDRPGGGLNRDGRDRDRGGLRSPYGRGPQSAFGQRKPFGPRPFGESGRRPDDAERQRAIDKARQELQALFETPSPVETVEQPGPAPVAPAAPVAPVEARGETRSVVQEVIPAPPAAPSGMLGVKAGPTTVVVVRKQRRIIPGALQSEGLPPAATGEAEKAVEAAPTVEVPASAQPAPVSSPIRGGNVYRVERQPAATQSPEISPASTNTPQTLVQESPADAVESEFAIAARRERKRKSLPVQVMVFTEDVSSPAPASQAEIAYYAPLEDERSYEDLDAQAMMVRIQAMEPMQKLAWLLMAPEHEIAPLSEDEANAQIEALLENSSFEELHTLRPVSYWISDPLMDMSLIHGRMQRVPNGSGRLPGDLPTRIESYLPHRSKTKRERFVQHNPQATIISISLIGILIAARFVDALERLGTRRVNPLRPAAEVERSASSANPAQHAVTLSGYGLALQTQSQDFFDWIESRQEAFRQQAASETHTLSSALSLAIESWTGKDTGLWPPMGQGLLSYEYAVMFTAMVQLGAMVDGAHLRMIQRTEALAWANIAEQTHPMDPRGLAVVQMLRSAAHFGYKLRPEAGSPNPLAYYARANLEVATAILLEAGFDPMMADSSGLSSLEQARRARAYQALDVMERFLSTTFNEKLSVEETKLQAQISAMRDVAAQFKTMSALWTKLSPAPVMQ